MTTIPPTCHHVFENIQFADSLGFKSFFIIPNVFEEWPEEKKLVLKNEMTKYGDYYIECLRNGTQPIIFSTFENAFRDIKAINSAISNQQYRVSPKCKACGKCGLGATRFASIHPNGNLYGCQEMTSNEGEKSIFYIGNIYTGVEDDRREALMALYDNNTVIGTNCETCKYNRICDGGCVANNYLATGSLTHTPKMNCWWVQTILEEAIRVMQILGNEGNETFRRKWGGMR
jgi:radical SAM protein with 4Fe4S-binding SPASM domain